MLFFVIARPFLIFAPYVLNPPNPYSDCSMYTVKATKKNAVRMADTQMKEVLTKKFIPHVEAKRRFIRLRRIPSLGVEDAAVRCPVEPGSPREIYFCNSEAYFTGVPSGCSTGVKFSPR